MTIRAPLETYQGLDLYSIEDLTPDQLAISFAGERAKQPLEALIALAKRASANRVVVEHDYIDFVYRDEYASFYGGIYANYGAQCLRLTFFASEKERILDILDSEDTICLGYCVLRPTLISRVGRSLFPAPCIPGTSCLPCMGTYQVHLFGRSFEVQGFPFMQQDGQVMRCAQVSMLMCMLFLQRAQSEPLSLPHEISEVATRDFVQLGRPFPSVGLLPSEINNFLWRVGYGPVRYDFPARNEYRSEPLIFIPYLLSRLPALLMSEDHSVVAVGFSLNLNREVVGPIARIQDYVGDIIVHDDGVGPYLATSASDDAIDMPTGKASIRIEDVRTIVIPCPRKMYLRAAQAEELALRLLGDIEVRASIAARAAEGCKIAKHTNDILSGRVVDDQLVLLPVLMTSQKLKEEALKRRASLDPRVCSMICESRLPRIVWVVEIGTLSSMRSGQWKAIGEIVLDATGHVAAMPELIVHLPGVVMSTFDGEFLDVDDESAYDSWLLYEFNPWKSS